MPTRNEPAASPTAPRRTPDSARSVCLPLATLAAALAAILAATPAAAGQWNFVGSRAQAMGGANVAAVSDSTAYYWNPAAFGFKKRGEWDVQLPVTMNVSIENQALENVSNLAFSTDDIASVLDAFENPVGSLPGLTQTEIDGTIQWLDDLNAIADQTQNVHSEIGIGLMGHAGHFGFGGLSNTDATIYTDIDLANLGLSTSALTDFLSAVPATGQQAPLKSDVAALGGFWNATTAAQLVDAFVAAPSVDINSARTQDFVLDLADSVNNGGAFQNNESGVVTVGLSLQEFGVSYGYALPSPVLKRWLDKKLAVGATAKYILGVAYAQSCRYVDGCDLGEVLSFDNAVLSSNFGLDLGIDYRPLPFARLAIVARNVNAPKFDAGEIAGKLKVQPQVRMGMSLTPIERFVLALDVDLTENQQAEATSANVPQSSFRSRLISLGTEYTIAMGKPSSLALRFGAYKNTVDSIEDGWALTGGLGLRLGGFWLDLSAGGGLERERVRVGELKYVNIPDRMNLGLGLKWEKSL